MAFLTTTAPADTPVRLPAPLPQQVRILESAKSRKVLRAGRRFSKSRTAMLAAIDGHGPVVDGQKALPGVLQGWDVVWLAKDYPQLTTVMWREEFLPRFKHLPYVDMNENEHRLSFRGLGTLYLRPETAINGIRGIGKRLKGVILDEAAFYDLEAVLRDVVLPALLDNEGWLMLMSTTNSGHDGNEAKRVPSYFNLICEQIARGERGPEWEEFYGTAYDNPRLSKKAIDDLIAEYEPGSHALEQEVFARLGVQGGRYYDMQADVHLVPPADVPSPVPAWWEVWGAYDWGYDHWAVFGLFARANGATFLLDSVWMRRQQDEAQADSAIALLVEYGVADRAVVIYAGHDCWQKVTARGASGKTTADVFAEKGLWITKADIDRANGGRAVRRELARATPERAAGTYLVDRAPRPGEVEALGMAANRRVYRQLSDALPDPLDVNKPMKVNAVEGKGGDDGAEMFRYGVATRTGDGLEPVARPEHGMLVQYDPTDLATLVRTEDEHATRPWDDLPAGF